MRPKRSRYGYNIPENWIQCKGCPDMVNEDVSNIYVYGYCSNCCRSVPDYISTEQWGDYLDAYYKKEVLRNGLQRIRNENFSRYDTGAYTGKTSN